MNLLDLAKKAESHFVNRDNGAGSSIIYKTFLNNTTHPTRAFVSFDDFRKVDEARITISDIASFCSVAIAFEPSVNDIIVLGTDEWKVVDFKPSSSGMYDIFCNKNKRHLNKSRNGGVRGL